MNHSLGVIRKIISHFFRSRKSYKAIITIFVLEACFFVAVVNIPDLRDMWQSEYVASATAPDEQRHYGNIKFYSQRNILDGPVIQHNEVESPYYFRLGEITRFPSYLYYYLLSFPAKILFTLGVNDTIVFVTLRLFSVLFGVLTLLVIHQILRELTNNTTVINLTLFATICTQAFVMIGSVINYDMLALLLFCLIMLFCTQSIKQKSFTPLTVTLPLFFLVSVTKYTYMPFAGLAIVIACLYIYREQGKQALHKLWVGLKWSAKIRKTYTILLCLLTIISAVLFIERIGLNAITYQQINPVCDKVFSHSECMNFSVYSRNYSLRESYAKELDSGEQYVYKNFDNIGGWLYRYTRSLYNYDGYLPNTPWFIMSALLVILAVFILFLLGINRKRIIENRQQLYIIIIAVVYVVSIYLFNERIYTNLGAYKANQARYIIFSVIILYFWLALLANATFKTYRGNMRKYLKRASITLLVIAFIIMNPLSSFFVTINTNPETERRQWIQRPFKPILQPFRDTDSS